LGLDDERLVASGGSVALATPHPLATAAGIAAVAHGTMGGKAQPQIHAQLLLHLRDGRSPTAWPRPAGWSAR
jgi:hypothetical protein